MARPTLDGALLPNPAINYVIPKGTDELLSYFISTRPYYIRLLIDQDMNFKKVFLPGGAAPPLGVSGKKNLFSSKVTVTSAQLEYVKSCPAYYLRRKLTSWALHQVDSMFSELPWVSEIRGFRVWTLNREPSIRSFFDTLRSRYRASDSDALVKRRENIMPFLKAQGFPEDFPETWVFEMLDYPTEYLSSREFLGPMSLPSQEEETSIVEREEESVPATLDSIHSVQREILKGQKTTQQTLSKILKILRSASQGIEDNFSETLYY